MIVIIIFIFEIKEHITDTIALNLKDSFTAKETICDLCVLFG